MVQLIELASLSALETAMRERGQESASLWTAPDGWSVEDALVGDWTRKAAHGLAHAIGAAATVIDFEAALIDGWLPAALRRRLVEETRVHLESLNLAGIVPPVVQGRLGSVRDARVVGRGEPAAL